MTAELKMTVLGGEELRKALLDPDLLAGPVRRFLARSAHLVEAGAKEAAPVDTGRLRSSIATRIGPTRALVGSNVVYAPFVEFGTRPHWPPLSAMQPWARRHGFPPGTVGAFLVARAISQRGTRPQPFLFPALEAARGAIMGFLRDMAEEVRRHWGKGVSGG